MVTRITNTMMTNTLLSNLSLNLNRMDKLQNQLSSGRKFGHISDDPSALIYGQAARNKLARVSHFQTTVETAQSWLTQAEMGLMELNKVVGAVYEELVSAGSVKTDADKKNLAMVVSQLRDHYVDTLNTSYGDRFVFGAYNTPGDHAAGKASEVKPFTIVNVRSDDTTYFGLVVPPIVPALDPPREVPRLHFNGFDISQFDGVSTAQFNTGLNNAKLLSEYNEKLSEYNEKLSEYNDKLLSVPPPVPPPTPPTPPTPPVTVPLPPSIPSQDDFNTLFKLLGDTVTLDVGPSISMPVTQNGIDVVFYVARDDNGNAIMRNTFDMLDEVYLAINGVPMERLDSSVDPDDERIKPLGTDDLTKQIKLVQDAQNHLLTRTAEIGGRHRRLELLEARYETDALNYEKMRSDAEDADMAEVIMFLKMAETIYQAALSAGARVIQPTLMDFLR